MATSPIFLRLRIWLTNGLNHALLGLFTKRPSIFSAINPQSISPLSSFKQNLKFYQNQSAI